jgi:tetratricopeptide (TPR) repeat protein
MVKELYPEHWLKNTFVELHRVFESFNGSMLVSCILLLIDKKNGCGYFLNAEHPNLVLYRKGESKFIEPRKILMKLGVSVDGLLEIEIIKLRSGDKLIMGSDGKDDLVLSVEGGVTIVNDDEKLFLEIVKESSGNLELIYRNLQERGEFRDDVSLISIEYKGDRDWKERNMYLSKEDKEKFDKSVELYNRNQFKEAENILEQLVERYKENGIIRKRLGYVKLKLGKYFEGLKELEKSFDLLPYDTHILKVLTKGYFKLKEYEKSIEYGELYILRESKDIEMFKHLIEVYEKLKDSPKERIRELAKKRLVKYKNYLNFYFNPNP